MFQQKSGIHFSLAFGLGSYLLELIGRLLVEKGSFVKLVVSRFSCVQLVVCAFSYALIFMFASSSRLLLSSDIGRFPSVRAKASFFD